MEIFITYDIFLIKMFHLYVLVGLKNCYRILANSFLNFQIKKIYIVWPYFFVWDIIF